MFPEPLRANQPLQKKITVIDNKTGQPLADAHVLTPTHKTVTNAAGEATVIVNDPTERVTISYMGYVTDNIAFENLSNYVQLVIENNELDEVVLVGKGKGNIVPWLLGGAALLYVLWPSKPKTIKI